MTTQPVPSSASRQGDFVPRLPLQVGKLSIEDGMTLAMWTAPGPWSVSDSLEAPEPDEGYWAVRDADDELVGYCCFGESARPPGLADDPSRLDVALGLRPDLVGHGLSNPLARTVVDHARVVAAGRTLRTAMGEWNDAGRRAAEKAGFKVSGYHQVPGGAAVSSYLVFTRT